MRAAGSNLSSPDSVGSLVVGNVWCACSLYVGALAHHERRGILHDPDSYDRPDEFDPSRFIKHKYGLKEGVDKSETWRNTFPYGAGRRICLGVRLPFLSLCPSRCRHRKQMYLAENSLSINIPKLLWAFSFKPVGKVSVDSFEPGTFCSRSLHAELTRPQAI